MHTLGPQERKKEIRAKKRERAAKKKEKLAAKRAKAKAKKQQEEDEEVDEESEEEASEEEASEDEEEIAKPAKKAKKAESSDDSDDDAPIGGLKKPKVTKKLLQSKIQAMSKTTEFETFSLKMIREKLGEDLDQDMTEYKKLIKEIVVAILSDA